GPAQPASRNF
ncbi:hypothetical protein KL914_005402, partial [Ogataea haglerorum]